VGGPGVQILRPCIGTAGAIIEQYRDKPSELRLPIWEPMSDRQMLDHIPRMGVVARQVETDLRSWVQELRRRGVTWSRIGGHLVSPVNPRGSVSSGEE